jgi:hypothetical protein
VGVELRVAIQHHPSRGAQLARLLDELGEPADVITDPDPTSPLRSPWRTSRLAWASTPETATHNLVLQDDVRACDGFLDLARDAVTSHPDDLVTFYVGRYPGSAARAVIAGLDTRKPYVDIGLDSWTPCLALAMPTAFALDLASHTDRHHYPPAMCADDGIVSLWRQDRGHTRCWATMPSLVDHDNDVPSIMGTEPGRMRCAVIAHPTLPNQEGRLGSIIDLCF